MGVNKKKSPVLETGLSSSLIVNMSKLSGSFNDMPFEP
jgi:hypothetical protein